MGLPAQGAEGELWREVCSAVRLSVPRGDPAAVAFSGGVDSSLVALACREEGLDPVLLTVGTAGSRDMRFAAHVAGLMRMPHRAMEIGAGDIAGAAEGVGAIVGECPLSWRENCVAFYHVARLASSLGIPRVITANGIDELFCGYDSYRRVAGDEAAIEQMIRDRVASELRMMEAVSAVAGMHGVEMAQPLLSAPFMGYSMRVPIHEKITGAGDLMRKHIVRRTAGLAGVPAKAAHSRKKALQYGSGIHAAMKR